MKKFVLLSLAATFVVVSSCKKDLPLPIASFTVNKGAGRVGTSVKFVNTSQNATYYEWDFGDGTTVQEVSPLHIFASAGDFAVKLKATGEGGEDISTTTVTILPQQFGITGAWNIRFNLSSYEWYGGTMSLLEQSNGRVSGSFTWSDNSATSSLLSSSLVTGYNVALAWMVEDLKLNFTGTVNSTFDHMSGSYNVNDSPAGEWNAARTSKKSLELSDVIPGVVSFVRKFSGH